MFLLPAAHSLVLSLPVVGVAMEHSDVLRGVVCRLAPDMVHCVHQNKTRSLRTAVSAYHLVSCDS